jgi:hypothetical protein
VCKQTTTDVGRSGNNRVERIFGGKTLEFVPEVPDNYSFYFSNSFSIITAKDISVNYHLENGRLVVIKFIL